MTVSIDDMQAGTPSDVPARSGVAVRFNLLEIGLRECKRPERFCVKVSARIRGEDIATKVVILDSILVYTNEYAGGDPQETAHRLYHVPTTERSQFRTLEKYCSETDLQVFDLEVSKGIRALVVRIKEMLMALRGPTEVSGLKGTRARVRHTGELIQARHRLSINRTSHRLPKRGPGTR